MNRERIVITPSNPAHHLEDVIDKNGVGHCFLHAVGVNQINEMSDYVVHAGDMVQYHVHTHGNELFIVTEGSVDAVLGGKRAIAHKGDMLLVRPHTPTHSITGRTAPPGTRLCSSCPCGTRT